MLGRNRPETELTFDYRKKPRQDLFNRYVDGNPSAPVIRQGIVSQVNNNPNDKRRIQGTVDVNCIDGSREINVQILTDSCDPKMQKGAGEFHQPYRGSRCLLITGPGGETYAVGFTRPVISGVGNTDDRDQIPVPSQATTSGDWTRISPSGARILLSAGGVVLLEATPSCFVGINKLGNEFRVVSQTASIAADGYKSRRGRVPGIGNLPDPRTRSTEIFQDKADGKIANLVVVEHGSTTTGAIKETTVLAGGKVLQGRETIDAAGNFVGSMKTYRFGGQAAAENIVLGQVLKTFISKFLDEYIAHGHGSAAGPTTQPFTAAQAQALKLQFIESDAILSAFMFAAKVSGV